MMKKKKKHPVDDRHKVEIKADVGLQKSFGRHSAFARLFRE